jgi:hypothetical protein
LFVGIEEVIEEMGAGLKDITVFCILFTDLATTFFHRTEAEVFTVSDGFLR